MNYVGQVVQADVETTGPVAPDARSISYEVAGESATAFMRRAVLEAAGPVARTRERLTTSTAHQIAQGPSGAHAGAAPCLSAEEGPRWSRRGPSSARPACC